MRVMEQTKPYIVTTTGGYGKIMTLNFQVTNFIHNVDLFFKQKEDVENNTSELIVLDPALMGTLGNVTDMPYSMLLTETDNESVCKALQADETITGVSSRTISAYDADVMGLKAYLAEQGIATGHLESSCDWSEFKLNSDGMIPVIVQDYKTNDVLMLAYMNEEAFQTTLSLGKITAEAEMNSGQKA